jgi:peptidoglycan/xylan/chitin deacetylase (PgdA/CDA1 family)
MRINRIKILLKSNLLPLLKIFGVFKLFRWINRNKIIILTYHGVTGQTHSLGLLNHAGLHINVGKFAEQMRFLKKNYNIIPLSILLDSIKNRQQLPRYSVVITFDDGYDNNYTHAFPVLLKHNLPATIFLATRYIGRDDLFWADRLEWLFRSERCLSKIRLKHKNNKPENISPRILLETYINKCKKISENQKKSFIEELEKTCTPVNLPQDPDYRCLNWGQVKEMYESGLVEVGSHTHNHVIMTRVSEEQALKELEASKKALKDGVGISPRSFSYPNGQHSDFDENTHQIVERQGFECALLSIEGLNRAPASSFGLKRLGIHASTALVAFEARVTGFQLFVSNVLKIGRLGSDDKS